MKTIFWANNIVDFTPYLDLTVRLEGASEPVVLVGTWFDKKLDLPTGDVINTGMRHMKSWWEVSGNLVQ